MCSRCALQRSDESRVESCTVGELYPHSSIYSKLDRSEQVRHGFTLAQRSTTTTQSVHKRAAALALPQAVVQVCDSPPVTRQQLNRKLSLQACYVVYIFLCVGCNRSYTSRSVSRSLLYQQFACISVCLYAVLCDSRAASASSSILLV
jgi:hypothetical protein